MQGDWSAAILLEASLPQLEAGVEHLRLVLLEVRDHFLCPKGAESATRRHVRHVSGRVGRYLIMDASQFRDRKEARANKPPLVKSFTVPV